MSRSSMLKLFGRTTRNYSSIARSSPITTSTRCSPVRQFIIPSLARPLRPISSYVSASRAFSTSKPSFKGLSPESENPTPKEAESHSPAAAPAEISVERFHELADQYLDSLIEKLEQLQEETEDIDCEYTAGVLTLSFPPNGTYVINKQPPNKQIWLSSPITGPKRYDYVILSEGQDAKEGTGSGHWVYLRDGSTLTTLLETEIGVDMSELWAPVPHLGE